MGIIYDLATKTREAIDNLAENVSDQVALKSKQFYRTWEELCNYNNGEGFTAKKAGFRFTYGDDLYKTVQPNQHFESQWVPGQGTSAIYTRIDEEHAGTMEDPIPVPEDVTTNAFVYVIGKYYTEGSNLYKCERTGDDDGKEYSLTYPPSQLVGNYFTLVGAVENEPA